MSRPPAEARDIAAFLGQPLRGESAKVRAIVPFPNSKPESVSFLSGDVPAELPLAPQGALVIARPAAAEALCAAGYAVIEAEHPKHALARVHAALFRGPEAGGVHASAVVGEEVSLGSDVSIGPGCVLDGPVRIGDGCVLAANVRVRGPATLGARVRIGSSAVIGEEAFSFGFAGPEALRFPADGGVEIGDDVEIGPSTFVAAGVFDPTRIESGAKLADLVSISNAVTIGRDTIVTARVAVSGRARIGAGCWLGQSCAVRQGVAVGDGALVAMGAVVVRDVAPGVVVMGNPASERRRR